MSIRLTTNIHDTEVVRNSDGRELPVGDRVSWQAANGSYHYGTLLGLSRTGHFVSVKEERTSRVRDFFYDDLEYAG
jgi:hypothetical protein